MHIAPTSFLAIFLAISGCSEPIDNQAAARDGHAVERGRLVIGTLGCGACHRIPGVPQARGTVGPPLKGFATRNLIAGRLPNRAGELAMWVRDAPTLDPQTAMPPMPMTEEEAQSVVAYLYSLDGN